MTFANYCLNPDLCGLGMDCSPCLQHKITQLEQRCAELEKDRRQHALDFFYWWWNQPGTNTEAGYDEFIRTSEDTE